MNTVAQNLKSGTLGNVVFLLFARSEQLELSATLRLSGCGDGVGLG